MSDIRRCRYPGVVTLSSGKRVVDADDDEFVEAMAKRTGLELSPQLKVLFKIQLSLYKKLRADLDRLDELQEWLKSGQNFESLFKKSIHSDEQTPGIESSSGEFMNKEDSEAVSCKKLYNKGPSKALATISKSKSRTELNTQKTLDDECHKLVAVSVKTTVKLDVIKTVESEKADPIVKYIDDLAEDNVKQGLANGSSLKDEFVLDDSYNSKALAAFLKGVARTGSICKKRQRDEEFHKNIASSVKAIVPLVPLKMEDIKKAIHLSSWKDDCIEQDEISQLEENVDGEESEVKINQDSVRMFSQETNSMDSKKSEIDESREPDSPDRIKSGSNSFRNIDNYDINDLRSDEETDDEEKPRKQIPIWANGTLLRLALARFYRDPVDLDEIFSIMDMPNLAEIFRHKRQRFYKRTSSAHWGTLPKTFKF